MTAFDQTSSPGYSEFIQLSRYSRWLPEEGRRETWEEVVRRLEDFWVSKYPEHSERLRELAGGIYNLEYMPSMRTLMTAGEALERDHMAGYNCAYRAVGTGSKHLEFTHEDYPDEVFKIPMKDTRVFDEILYVLMCGTGVGYSVERQFVNQLPTIGKPFTRKSYRRTKQNYPGVDKDELSVFNKQSNTIRVADSKYGWASALRILIVELYNGNFSVGWDTSRIRGAGEPLKTFGGRASGPEPLNLLFKFIVKIFKGAEGRKLTSLEAHDILCLVAKSVVVGGVRRSALLSLSNLSDQRMASAKSGEWWKQTKYREIANNSICYTEKPEVSQFMQEFKNLYDSKSGERGIFNRESAANNVPERRDPNHDWGCNPCSEIVLRDQQCCNLTEVVIRSDDTFEDLKRKVEAATILGTLQATLTDFKYVNPKWKENAEEERLLGVSLTGIMDHPVMSGLGDGHEWFNGDLLPHLSKILEELRDHAISVNKEWAAKLGINPATAITTVKPSGTVSQLVDSASGIHSRHSQYYIRTVRGDKKDPLARLMVSQGFPHEDEIGKEDTSWVFSFPMKAPSGSIFRNDRTAIEQLELWLIYQKHWCEHKPSITVNVKEDEWLGVQAWVWKHFDEVSGISFLPYDGGIYPQAPYQEITEEQYEEALRHMPKQYDWSRLGEFETEDRTKGSQEYACSGGSCEIVDLTNDVQ